MNTIRIWTDGAATIKCKNGEYIRCEGASAIAIVNENDKIEYSKTISFAKATNNYCELQAIVMALDYFINHYSSQEDKLEIYSDSAYCVNMLKEKGWIYSWVKNGWTRGKKHEPIENLEVIKDIWSMIQDINVTFIKVQGHSGNNDFNDFVDKLAVKAKENSNESR